MNRAALSAAFLLYDEPPGLVWVPEGKGAEAGIGVNKGYNNPVRSTTQQRINSTLGAAHRKNRGFFDRKIFTAVTATTPTTTTMGSRGQQIFRTTMFKVPDPANQKKLVEMYNKLAEEQKKVFFFLPPPGKSERGLVERLIDDICGNRTASRTSSTPAPAPRIRIRDRRGIPLWQT